MLSMQTVQNIELRVIANVWLVHTNSNKLMWLHLSCIETCAHLGAAICVLEFIRTWHTFAE